MDDVRQRLSRYAPACGDGETWPANDTNLVYYLASDSGSADIEFEDGVLMPYLSRNAPATLQALMRCRVATSPPSPNVSYVFSADLKPENGPKRLTQIRHSSERIPLVGQETPDTDGNFDPDDDNGTGCTRHFHYGGSGASATGKGNYGFADGHVAHTFLSLLLDHQASIGTDRNRFGKSELFSFAAMPAS